MKLVIWKNIFLVFLLLIIRNQLPGQACCSAGTPLLSNLEVSSTSYGDLQLSVNYEYNFLNDVLSGKKEIKGLRKRISQSIIIESSYGLSRRFSLTGLISFIQQERSLNNRNTSSSLEELTTRGVGDAVALLVYDVLPLNIGSQRQISAGLGIKMPTGKSDLKQNGFLLPADMQPGTGAWDGLLWFYFFQGFLPASKTGIFANFSYRFTGVSDRFERSGAQFDEYKFGNETVFTSGISHRFIDRWDLTFLLRYRHSEPDRNEFADIPNTGGKWLYVVPGVNINFDLYAIRIAGQIPLYRKLTGIQLTTSYTFSASFHYRFSFKNK
jgi:hypothetical protein